MIELFHVVDKTLQSNKKKNRTLAHVNEQVVKGEEGVYRRENYTA